MPQANVSLSPADALRMAFESIDRRDLSNGHEIWADDVHENFIPIQVFHGRQETLGHFERVFAAMPDFRMHVERIVSEGPIAVVQWRASGTFTGEPFYGLEPTGRRMEQRGCDVVEYNADGLVARNDIYYDAAAMMRDLGALPAQGSLQERVMLGLVNFRSRLTRAGRRNRARKTA